LPRLASFVFGNMKKIMNTSNFIQVSMRVVTVLFCIEIYAQSEKTDLLRSILTKMRKSLNLFLIFGRLQLCWIAKALMILNTNKRMHNFIS